MAAIQIENFVKDYGPVRVLKEVSLDIQDGEFVVLLGPSGCGKSTMLRMLAGLEEITSGSLKIGGTSMNDVPASERGVAMVFQNYALYPHMNVFDNIAFGLRRLKVPAAEIDRRVRDVAALLSLGELLQRKPKQLSGGQQQRVAMARAMIKTPKVFLFDEPLSNLDAKLREHLRVEIKKLHRMLKTTTVFVTHDQLEAMTLADKIVVMNAGVIEQLGTPRQVYYEPASLFVANFIGSPGINLLTMTVAAGACGLKLQAKALSLTLDASRYQALAPRREVVVGIRPKDFRLFASGDAAQAWSGEIQINEMMGSETLINVKLADGEVQLLVEDFGGAEPGARIAFAPLAKAVHLFDAQTGRSLRCDATDATPTTPPQGNLQ